MREDEGQCGAVLEIRARILNMFKILARLILGTTFVNTSRTMRILCVSYSCRCLPVRAKARVARMFTTSSRQVLDQFTTSTQLVHEQFAHNLRIGCAYFPHSFCIIVHGLRMRKTSQERLSQSSMATSFSSSEAEMPQCFIFIGWKLVFIKVYFHRR